MTKGRKDIVKSKNRFTSYHKHKIDKYIKESVSILERRLNDFIFSMAMMGYKVDELKVSGEKAVIWPFKGKPLTEEGKRYSRAAMRRYGYPIFNPELISFYESNFGVLRINNGFGKTSW